MRPLTIFTAFALLIGASGNAYAYLDPGTGSIILQALIATVASSLFVIKMYWYKLKAMFGGSSHALDQDDEAGPAQ